MVRTQSYSTNTCPVHSAALMRKKLSGRRSSGTSRILFSCSSSAFPGCTQTYTNLYCQHPQWTCMNISNLPLLVSQSILLTHKHKSLLPASKVDMHQHSNLTLLVSQRTLLTHKHKSLLSASTADMHEHSNLTLLVSQVKGFCLQTNTNLYCQHPQWTYMNAPSCHC